MNGSWHYVMEDRGLRQQDLARRMAERERYARSRQGASLRARLARRLFEREETWRLVWERLEARGRL